MTANKRSSDEFQAVTCFTVWPSRRMGNRLGLPVVYTHTMRVR